MIKKFTLCTILQNNKILLGMKKRGFGEGRWNGFGGKINSNETIKEATIREVKEESCIDIVNPKKRGVIEFRFEKDKNEILQVHIFSVNDFSGAPKETEEMLPKWFNIDDIPYNDMWSDDKYWLPMLLDGKNFTGSFLFGGENDDVLKYNIKEI
jgi:ADP-ribose pyrophosphatase YjhB (NUDIX family)